MAKEGERDSVIQCFRGRIKIPRPELGEGLTGIAEDGVEGEAGWIKAYRFASCTAVTLWEEPDGGQWEELVLDYSHFCFHDFGLDTEMKI